MDTKHYAICSDAETDTLLKWLSDPDNYKYNYIYSSYCRGVKTRACAAIAEVLGETKTKEQVGDRHPAGPALYTS